MYKFILVALIFFILTKSASSQTISPAEIGSQLVYHGLSKKLIDCEDKNSFLDDFYIRIKQNEDDERAALLPNASQNPKRFDVDGAVQKSTGIATSTATIIQNLPGLSSKYLRSDNNIAVGTNHVVQLINSNSTSTWIRVWNKSGEVIIDRAKLIDLFGFYDYGDANIIYDEQADRYVITFLYSGEDNTLIIVASETADPTGAWYYYTFETPSGFPDYEKIGVWGDSYIVTVSAGKPAIYALNRNAILSGAGATEVLQFKPYRIPNIGWQGLSPISQTGALPAVVGEPAIVARVIDDAWFLPMITTDHLELFSLTINWDDPSSSFMTGPLELPIESYNSDLCGFNSNSCLEQKDGDKKLWPISNFLMDKPQHRIFDDHQSIVFSHVCNADGEGTAGVRWYELQKETLGDWFVYQQSTFSPDEHHHWASSVTINGEGTIAMGYNITSTTMYPSIRVAGRTKCDPLNTLTTGEIVVKNSLSPNASLNWGDYNSIVTDPIDGSFWFTSQWNKTPKWSTNVVHFTIDGCETEKVVSPHLLAKSEIGIAPNPVQEVCQISFYAPKNANGVVQVFNESGVLVIEIEIAVEKDFNQITLDMIQHSPGVYRIQINMKDTVLFGSFIVY